MKSARESILDFTTYTYPGYEVNWHHQLICEHLDRFATQRDQRLMVFVQPRSGKSELVSRRLPAFLLGRDPDAAIIAASYGADLARRMNRDVQRIIDDEAYRRLFPGTTLTGKNVRSDAHGSYLRNSDMFEVVGRKGYYMGVGVGSAVTGMGGRYLLMDDPVKNRKEANSATYRQSIWEWYTSTFYTRLAPGGNILLTVTRWHCLLPSSCGIMTCMSTISVHSITSQQEVLTSCGPQKVEATASRHYQGDAYAIQVFGYPEVLKVTSEHRILTDAGWKEAREISAGDWLVFPIPQGETTREELVQLVPDLPLADIIFF
jgi:hypothetical protein